MNAGSRRRAAEFTGVLTLALLCSGSGAPSADAPKAEPAPPPKPAAGPAAARVKLPKLAVVEQDDSRQQGWQVSGHIGVAFEVARRDFRAALERQGWRLSEQMPLQTVGYKAELAVWRQGGQETMVLLTQDTPRRCDFSVGTYSAADGE
jgi:hypothetical protein